MAEAAVETNRMEHMSGNFINKNKKLYVYFEKNKAHFRIIITVYYIL